MIAVGDRLVAAVGAVAMTLLVAAAGVAGRAGSRVRGSDLQHVVIDVIAVYVVQVTIVQVVRVAIVPDGHMAATRTVLMSMPLMHVAVLVVHFFTPLCGP
jgi:hypothetical protein